jgi:hypothetical protein
MSKYAKPPTATDSFPKNGDAGPEVTNASGAPSQYMQPVGRSGPTTPDLGGENKSNRSASLITGETGQALTEKLDKGLSRAAQHREQVRGIIEGSEDPAGYLSHIFGLRDRASLGYNHQERIA